MVPTRSMSTLPKPMPPNTAKLPPPGNHWMRGVDQVAFASPTKPSNSAGRRRLLRSNTLPETCQPHTRSVADRRSGDRRCSRCRCRPGWSSSSRRRARSSDVTGPTAGAEVPTITIISAIPSRNSFLDILNPFITSWGGDDYSPRPQFFPRSASRTRWPAHLRLAIRALRSRPGLQRTRGIGKLQQSRPRAAIFRLAAVSARTADRPAHRIQQLKLSSTCTSSSPSCISSSGPRPSHQ